MNEATVADLRARLAEEQAATLAAIHDRDAARSQFIACTDAYNGLHDKLIHAQAERDKARERGCVSVDGKPSGAACAQINEWYIQASTELEQERSKARRVAAALRIATTYAEKFKAERDLTRLAGVLCAALAAAMLAGGPARPADRRFGMNEQDRLREQRDRAWRELELCRTKADDLRANVETVVAPWPPGPRKGDVLRALRSE